MAIERQKSKALVPAKTRGPNSSRSGNDSASGAKAALNRAGRLMSDMTTAATEGTKKAATAVAVGTRKSAAAGKEAFLQAGNATAKAGRAIGKTAADVGDVAAKGAGIVGMTLLDLNNDGKIDDEDFKIAVERSLAVAKQAADELASSDTVKGAAKSGIVVATIAIPVPLVGPAFGFAVGAGGYLTIKAVKEIGEAIGTAVGGVSAIAGPTRRTPRPKKK